MKKLVLLRHGESQWNKENRFTGWKDVDLTAKGVEEARASGSLMRQEGLEFDFTFTSVLKRAIRTLNLALEEMDRLWLPVEKDWRLNERHYGALQGLNKAETAQKFGEQQVLVWRRSYDTPPPALTPDDERYPGRDRRYAHLTPEELPLAESLKEIGVAPADIKHFALSHAHGDHSGNANLFSGATLYIPDERLRYEERNFRLELELAAYLGQINGLARTAAEVAASLTSLVGC